MKRYILIFCIFFIGFVYGTIYAGVNEDLLKAAEEGKIEEVKRLLSAGANVNAKGGEGSGYGSTALMSAAEKGHTVIAKLLIEKGADINARTDAGWTVLMSAARNSPEIAKVLIQRGADVNAKGNWGGTALDQAVWGGHTDVVKLLIEKGANVNVKDSGTLLNSAAKSANAETVSLLITKGADVNTKDNDGSTPLHAAATEGKTEIVKLLIEKGADVNVINKNGETPLASAEKAGKRDVAEILRSHGAENRTRAVDEESLGKQAEQAGNLRQALTHYVEALKSAPLNQQLREKIINIALQIQPPPAIPEDAKRHMARGQAAIKAAKAPEDWAEAVKEYEKAVYFAPWYADAYYNLGVARDKAGQYDEAIWALKMYLMAKPQAVDTEQVKSLIFEIEYRKEKAAQEALKPKPPRPQDLAGIWYHKYEAKGLDGIWRSFSVETQVSVEGDWLLFSRFENAGPYSSGRPFAKFRLNGFELEESSIEKSGLTDVSGEGFNYECAERLRAQGGFRERMVSVRGKVSADGKKIIFQYRDMAQKQGCQLGYHDFEVTYTR